MSTLFICPSCARRIPARVFPVHCVCNAIHDDPSAGKWVERTTEATVHQEPRQLQTGRGYPGAELAALLAELDIQEEGCGCKKFARKMNRWGVAGCREHRQEIVDRLKEKAGKRDWGTKVWAAVRVVATGATWLNPLDIYGSLADEAIRRAEAKGMNDA